MFRALKEDLQAEYTPHFLFEVRVSSRMIEPTPASMRL
jgi:hypothetical protein